MVVVCVVRYFSVKWCRVFWVKVFVYCVYFKFV